MTSSYLLPGEQVDSSSTIQTHGMTRKESFISIPRIYEPKEKDLVIGIVIVRTPDIFLVDINSSESAILPITSFDNGRLPNRNTMNRLSVVYAHVVCADPWTQTELSCRSTDSSKKKTDFGLINEGNILRCSLALCEKLQRSNLINQLNRIVRNFWIRITRNGFLWYTTDTMNSMIAVKNVLYEHELENNIERLINLYQIFFNKLQEQDDRLVNVKQQTMKKQDVEIKKIEQPINNNNAVTRLLNQVIKSVLEKIIDDIEKNENN